MKKEIEVLKELFPNCFDKQGNFNIEKFQNELKQNEISITKESYGLEWLGKSYARVRTFDPARTLLKENEEWNEKEENKNSENLLIKGDNLEVLKHLSNAYYKKIKMIYIDPPYNTGSDNFVYSDDRKFNIDKFMELAGISEERAKRVLEFVDSKSNSHSAWLTFIYPRLYIARKLLKDDGVIFVSIDDNEVAQLRLLMDEIFGEENFLNTFCWINNLKGRQISNKGASKTFEYILAYAKNKDNKKIKTFEIDTKKAKELMPSSYKGFNYKIEKDILGEFITKNELYNTNSAFNEETRKNLVFNIHYNFETNEVKFSNIDENIEFENFIKIPPKKNNNGTHNFQAWRWQKDKIKNELHNLKFVKNGNEVKIFTKIRDYKKTTLKDIITD